MISTSKFYLLRIQTSNIQVHQLHISTPTYPAIAPNLPHHLTMTAPPPSYTHQRSASVQERIIAAASENNGLLNTLSETDYAPAAVQQTNHYITTLNKQIQEKEAQIKKLYSHLYIEKQQHEKYQNSTMKRLAYKMSGKRQDFEEKARREEREYVEARQMHFEESENLKRVQSDLREAQHQLADLESVNQRHKSAQQQLDALYASIFDGPTPEFPQEDQIETLVSQTSHAFQDAQKKYSAETQVYKILVQAQNVMGAVTANMAAALQASEADMWGFGGSFADMAERSSLAKAQQGVSQAEMLISQARQLSNDIGPLPKMRIAEGNLISDVLFDNIWSDMKFHDKIEASALQVRNGRARLQMEIDGCKGRCTRAKDSVDREGRALADARRRLQETRIGVFDAVAGGLPEYSA